MANSNEIGDVWKEGKAHEAGLAPLTANEFQAIISSRVRKELTTVSQFVWAAIAYQIILYSFLTHTLVRHWGEMRFVLLCLAGAALYIPLTIALIRRAGTLFLRNARRWRTSGFGTPTRQSNWPMRAGFRRVMGRR